MGSRHIRTHCAIGNEPQRLLETAVDKLGMSARAYNRILKIARTLADLAGADTIGVDQIAEAIQYRTLDRRSSR
jgi:magnesium chelatase family protein